MATRIRNRIYIPAKAFATVEDAIGLGTGVPNITQVTSRDMVGWQLDALTDEIVTALKLPFFLDPEQDVGFRINWISGSVTAGDTVDFTILYEAKAVDVAIPTSITQALDTAIAQDTIGAATAFLNKWTARGILDKDTWALTRAQVEAGALLMLMARLDAVDIDLATEKLWILGVELDFVERYFEGSTDSLAVGLTSEV